MDNIERLRNRMRTEGIDIVIIPSGDYHQSEYSCEYFRQVCFFSGFTGSAGTLVVSMEEAALFTDGRYYIQAEKQIDNSRIKLMKSGMEGVPTVSEYVCSLCGENSVVAFDGRIVDAGFGKQLKIKLPYNNCLRYDFCPSDDIWKDRPALPKDKAFILELKYSGEDTLSKLSKIRMAMKKTNCDTHIVSSLDDIAWILNIRGNDIAYNPVIMSYLIVGETECYLYSDTDKYDENIVTYIESKGVTIKDYDSFYQEIDSMSGKKILLDLKRINYYMYESLIAHNSCVFKDNPSLGLKAVKNETEINNLKKAHIKDGVAVTKFFIWLKQNIGKQKITEWDAMEHLAALRREQEGFIEESFNTISAYGPNAAMMHYSCDKESAAELEPRGMILVDSGGQYFEGTTDVTRTFALGPVSDEEKRDFTLVLKGMLNLTHAKFLHGCIGLNLDILARGPLWEHGIDYRCGTGHGVSYLASVHESPNGFRWKHVPERDDGCVLEAGMVTSNEPGVYVEGKYGIRTENEIVCVEAEKNEYGQFMEFETLTQVPIDTSLIDIRYLSPLDIERINKYNTGVICKLLEHFDKKEITWLEKNVKILH